MRAELPDAAMRRVASMPSTPGIRTSISTTSGCSALHERDGLGAVARLADHLHVLLGLEDHAEAAADERLVVGDQTRTLTAPPRAADGHAPCSRRRAEGRPRASRRAGPRARACLPGPVRCRSRRRPWSRAAIVANLQLHRRVAVAHGHLRARRVRVSQRVRQRLLDDPVTRTGPLRRAPPAPPPRAAPPRPARRPGAARPARRGGRGRAAAVWDPELRWPPPLSSVRSSRSASRPACSIDRSAARAWSGRVSKTSSAALACTTITDTLWAITSCSSRAMRACSSPAARRAPPGSPSGGCARPRRAPTRPRRAPWRRRCRPPWW